MVWLTKLSSRILESEGMPEEWNESVLVEKTKADEFRYLKCTVHSNEDCSWEKRRECSGCMEWVREHDRSNMRRAFQPRTDRVGRKKRSHDLHCLYSNSRYITLV